MCGDGNFSLLVYYGEDFALLGEFLCPRRQRNQNAAGAATRNFIALSAPPRTPITGEQAALR